ncbi:MAG: NADH-quinone oxidoreductase subunit NuoE [Bacillota bacterium]|jgi:NADH-quinone oxidoreductase E subunit
MKPTSKGAGISPAHIGEILQKYSWSKDALVAVLHDVQKAAGCLSEEALAEIASGLDIPISKVYGVATFYTLFSVKPKGEYIIRVCENAPCHVLGAKAIVGALEKELGISMGNTTPDGKFTLEYTSCLGVCGVAPAIMINDAVYGNLTPERVPVILKEYK